MLYKKAQQGGHLYLNLATSRRSTMSLSALKAPIGEKCPSPVRWRAGVEVGIEVAELCV